MYADDHQMYTSIVDAEAMDNCIFREMQVAKN